MLLAFLIWTASGVLFIGIGIFEHLGLMDAEILAGLKAWFTQLCDWILTHEYGIGADNSDNNHGSWHDANIIATAVFLGRNAIVKKICKTAYWNRIQRQITEAGEQPRELARTKGMSYTFFNYDALAVVANIAERNGYAEYWGVDAERGHCILRRAVDFIYPYVLDPKSFPYQEFYPERQSSGLKRSLLTVAKRYPGEGYEEKAEGVGLVTEPWVLEPVL